MANFHENSLNQLLDEAFVTTSLTNVNALIDGLPQNSLNPEQQARLSSINVDNKRFAERVLTVMQGSGAGILPNFFSDANLSNDLGVFEQLETLENRLQVALGRVSDLKRIAGHEAYATANGVYNIYKMAALGGIPQAEEDYEFMKERYEGQGGNNKPDEPEDGI
tara:strand:+ start:398 stop:892 length:495 start_codon:yes stop_codon:yes gene_type:complete